MIQIWCVIIDEVISCTCILLQWRRTALHDAAMMGQVQAIETLIRLGADVNALDQVSWYVCDEMN